MTGTAASVDRSSEAAVRERLRVPIDAPRVMVVTETTHWDPNWLCTSTEYFRWRVRRCLDLAIDALVADPRRVFSLECVFFPDLYWDARPERRHLFRSLVNERRLRFTGSGVTTPDTLLPEVELLLRDLLIGQEWMRARGMTQEPRMLYLPDSFGHSPGLPSLLEAADPLAGRGHRRRRAGRRFVPSRTRDGGRASAVALDDREVARPSWTRRGHLVSVSTSTLTAVFDERRSGTLVELTDTDGNECIDAPSLELRSYAESGGLWRMGHEFKGGGWSLADRSSEHPAEVIVGTDDHGGLRVEIHASLEGRAVEVTVKFGHDEPHLIVRTWVTAPRRRTVTLAIDVPARIEGLLMHQPGGIVARRLQRWYDPTFWPFHSFAAALPAVAKDGEARVAVTAATATPTALHATPAGLVETVVARTATKELAFGVIPVMAPAWGLRWGTQHAAVGWSFSSASDTAEVSTVGRQLQHHIDRAVGRETPDWLVGTGDALVEVLAVKVADRGDGIIVRLRSWANPVTEKTAQLTLAPGLANGQATIADAWRTDSCERDLDRVVVRDGIAHLTLDSHLTTIRLAISRR